MIYGIQSVKIFAREIISPTGSKLEFSAPDRTERYKSPAVTGKPGKPGGHGIVGPQGKMKKLMRNLCYLSPNMATMTSVVDQE